MMNLLNKPVNTVGDVIKVQLAEYGICVAASIIITTAVGGLIIHKSKKLYDDLYDED